MEDIVSLYQMLVEKYEVENKQLKRRNFYIAILRLATFVAFTYCTYLAFSQTFWIIIFLCIFLLAMFLWLISLSSKITARKKQVENLLLINRNELAIINGGVNMFDNGLHQNEPTSYYNDLDVFGEGSIYQLLNRTSTLLGAKALGIRLKHTTTDVEVITSYQQAIQTFAPQNQNRQNIMSVAMGMPNESRHLTSVYTWVKQPVVVLHNQYLQVARFVLPIVNLTGIVVYLSTDFHYLLTLSVLISWLHVGYVSSYVKAQTEALGKKQETLQAYAGILQNFEKTDPGKSVVLQQLLQQSLQADSAIQKLSQLVGLLDQRLNVLVNILLNSIFLYDVQCLVALEKWKISNRENLSNWMDVAGEVECLASLATYAFNHPKNCYPTFTGEVSINATSVYHPLLPVNTSVSNNISMGNSHRLMLITGSNMSGKTTYLRTVGANVLLAQCGLPVCASQFHFSPMHIYSSIRVSDSLQENTSYFMAELKQLHYIIQNIDGGKASLVLIDEILRGTNSEDKYHGSHQFVQHLIKYNCLTLFATHDLALSRLEDEYAGQVKNYCFESTIQNNELYFDYKIMPGVAKNRNATFLMKKMGII